MSRPIYYDVTASVVERTEDGAMLRFPEGQEKFVPMMDFSYASWLIATYQPLGTPMLYKLRPSG